MSAPTGRRDFCSFRAVFGNNALTSDSGEPTELQISPIKFAARHRCAFLALIVLGLGACSPSADAVVAPAAGESPPPAGCGTSGFLRARLFGEFAASLDWSNQDLECKGMPRPAGAGARLRFAGRDHQGERQLAFIVAIPDLDRDSAGRELASIVTLIEEGGGRFFSTASAGNCVADVSAMTALDDSGDRFAISGALYCVSPLAEVNGTSSVSIPELHFSGLIDWSSS
jgi:hypothetical protein